METTPAKRAGCDSTTRAQKALVREIVGQFASKWPLWTLHVLQESGGPLRFARLLERVEGVSQKMLTQTLRQLERDGLVARAVYAEVPPRVEYTLTQVGRETLARFMPFWAWVVERLPSFERARARFDGDAAPSSRAASPVLSSSPEVAPR